MPESITKQSSDVNMKSIQEEEEVPNMCVGSLITWYNPNCDVTLSITLPSKVNLS